MGFYTIFVIVMSVLTLYFCLKNFNTYKQQTLILNSIKTYVIYNHNTHGFKLGSDMIDMIEPYSKTLFRLFDWGYEHILPDEYYQVLRPYIIMTKEKK